MGGVVTAEIRQAPPFGPGLEKINEQVGAGANTNGKQTCEIVHGGRETLIAVQNK